jgi:hypothetical protein
VVQPDLFDGAYFRVKGVKKMSGMRIPTSRDIYIEADGVKVAAVQNYQVKTKRENREIEVFGSAYPAASLPGRTSYTIALQKVLIQKGTDVDFYGLSDFSLVIAKPERRIIFTGCEWQEISEDGNLSLPCLERVVITAAKRMVTT